MNKELKVGDIVILAEGHRLDNMETILAKENHLFEVESQWGNDAVDLKSISTGFKTGAYKEDVRYATLKEQYLRDGNSIVFNGKGYLVSGDTIVGLEYGFDTDYFNDDLLAVPNRKPITKVFNSTSGSFENKTNVNHHSATVLWERKPKIELTSDEVIILKNVDGMFKYIARDNLFGSLSLFEKEPTKSNLVEAYVSDVASNWQHLSPFNNLFQDITFESGVHLIDDLIRENKKRKN